MAKSGENWFKDDNAVVEVLSEILLIAIISIAFVVVASFTLYSIDGPDNVRVDIKSAANAETDSLYFRHTGGENIDIDKLEFLISVNDTSYTLTPENYYSDDWYLGDIIKITIPEDITEKTKLESKIIHTNANLVIYDAELYSSNDFYIPDKGNNSGNEQQPLSAEFSFFPQSPTSYEIINFTDLSTPNGNITSWSWDFGDSNTSTDQNPSHQYSSEGTYTVTLTVTDDNSNTDSTSQDVNVTDTLLSADFTYSPQNPTSYDTVTFTDQSMSDGTITSWSWDFGDGNTTTNQNPSHQYSSEGTYTVTLTVTDDNSNTDSFSQDLTVMDTSGTFADQIILNKPAKGGVIKDGGYVSFTSDGNYRYIDIDGTRYDLNQSDSIKLEVVNDQTTGEISMSIGNAQISTFDLNVNLYINNSLKDTGQVTDIYVQPISTYYSTLRYELPAHDSQVYLEADGDVIIDWNDSNDSAINISNIGFYSPGNTQIDFNPTSTYIKCSGFYQLKSPQSNASETALPTPISLWNFDINNDNTVVDSEDGNDGTISRATRVGAGVNNSAIQFEQGPSQSQGVGTKEYITIPNSNNLDLTSEGSVEAWVYVESYEDYAGIVHKGELTNFNDESYTLQFGGGGGALGSNQQILFGLNNGEYLVLSNTQIPLQSWHHVVGTWNSTSINVYINGNLENTNTDNNIEANPSSGSLQIGAQFTDGSYGYNGILDEIAIYNYTLNATEVQQRYDLYS